MLAQLEQAQGGIDTLSEILDKDSKVVGAMKTAIDGVQKTIDNLPTLQNNLEIAELAVSQDSQANITAYNHNKDVVEKADQNVKDAKEKTIASIEASITALENAKKALQQSATTTQTNEDGEEVTTQSSVDTSAIDTQISNLRAQEENVKNITEVGQLESFTDMSTSLGNLNTALTEINNSLTTITTTVSTASDQIADLKTDVEKSNTILTTLKEAIKDADLSSLKTMGKDINDAIDQLEAGTSKLREGAKLVASSVDSLQVQSKAGIDKIKAGTTQLTSNNATLNGGASALSDATGTLAGQSGTFNEMADGLDTLGKAFETLNSGAKQLYEGNEQFKSEGLDQLKEKVDLGVGELETLQSVMDEIKAMNKEYASYSGAPEDATVTSRYVFRTKDKEESSK